MGIFGVDLPCDLRDLSADIKNWEWNKEHVIRSSFDFIALIPLVGVLKYTDEAVAIGKNAVDSVDEVVEGATTFAKNAGDVLPGSVPYYIKVPGTVNTIGRCQAL